MIEPQVVRAADLPGLPLDAANQFYAELVPPIRDRIARSGDVIIAFDHMPPEHKAWRLAAIQALAREAAPARVNAVVGPLGEEMTTVCHYLANAPGVTGQVFELDGAES